MTNQLNFNKINKTIFFIRHGEAFHNPPVEKFGKEILTDIKYFDAKLTKKGKSQCEYYSKKLKDLNLEIIFASPLTRTLQTASRIFKKTPIFGLEVIRERHGIRHCDARRGLNVLKKEFKNINFDMCEEGNGEIDPVWKLDKRETEKELKNRITEFLKWVKTRKETRIGVVTHQGYMCRLYQILNREYTPPKNCESLQLEL